jgi:hypothetical protein
MGGVAMKYGWRVVEKRFVTGIFRCRFFLYSFLG